MIILQCKKRFFQFGIALLALYIIGPINAEALVISGTTTYASKSNLDDSGNWHWDNSFSPVTFNQTITLDGISNISLNHSVSSSYIQDFFSGSLTGVIFSDSPVTNALKSNIPPDGAYNASGNTFSSSLNQNTSFNYVNSSYQMQIDNQYSNDKFNSDNTATIWSYRQQLWFIGPGPYTSLSEFKEPTLDDVANAFLMSSRNTQTVIYIHELFYHFDYDLTTWTRSNFSGTDYGGLFVANEVTTPVPEPSTIVLFIIGFAGLIGLPRTGRMFRR